MKETECIPKGFYGTKLYIEDQRLMLVISYDDIDAEDLERFCQSDVEVEFKMIDMVSMFIFKFQQYLVETSFDLFASHETWKTWGDEQKDLILDIWVCDSVSGKRCATRQIALPREFSMETYAVLSKCFESGYGNYSEEQLRNRISNLYDNHTVDEIYAIPSNQSVICRVN